MQPSLSSNPENYTPHFWKKALLLSGAGAATIAVALGGYALVQWFGNGEARTSLQFATTLQQQGDFQGCVDQARLVASGSSLYNRAEDILQSCQLSQANALAQQNNLTEAVKLLGEIPSDSPLNANVQNALDDWSKMLIDRASAQYDMGKREEAFAMLRTIPETSSEHQAATAQIDQWNVDWDNNSERLQKIRQVLQVNDLKSAFAELQQITTLYWTQQAHDIILTKITDIIAYEQSVAAANAEKLAIAQQLQAEAERLLHEAKAKAERHYQQSHAHPKPHHWHPPHYWIPLPWRGGWVPPVPIPFPHPPAPPSDHLPDTPPHGGPGTGPIGDEPPVTEPPGADPGTTDPPIVTDPVVTDPIVTDPETPGPITDPVVTDPVVTDPVVTDPVVTDPVVTDPVITDPVVTDPIITDPETPGPITDPVVTDPVITDPTNTDPVVTDPVVTDPVVTDPIITDPIITDPVNTEPEIPDPVVVDPPVVDPVVIDPAPSTDPIAPASELQSPEF